MTSHRDNTREPAPNWLKAWYAFLVFLTVVTILTLILK
jgi:hypothetical protein